VNHGVAQINVKAKPPQMNQLVQAAQSCLSHADTYRQTLPELRNLKLKHFGLTHFFQKSKMVEIIIPFEMRAMT
jgi:hypothetical protein